MGKEGITENLFKGASQSPAPPRSRAPSHDRWLAGHFLLTLCEQTDVECGWLLTFNDTFAQ